MKRQREEPPEANEETDMSEYEKLRLENIRRNQAMLHELNIETTASLFQPTKKPVREKIPRPKKTKLLEPVRRSPRIRGEKPKAFSPDSFTTDTERPVAKQRQAGPINAVPTNDIGEMDSQTFLKSFDILSKTTKINVSVISEEMSTVESYKKRMSKLHVNADNVRKIVWGRITTMAIHPSCDKTIVCAGDKYGNIGFWNVDPTSTDNSQIFIYSPHVGNVRELCFHPEKNDLVSCSSDGTLRRADFTTCVFDEVYASDDYGINAFSYPCNSRDTFLLGFEDGHLAVVDTREAKNKATSHLCHNRSIKCLHCSPVNEHLFCTSSSDATVALWDVRKIKGIKSNLDQYERHNRSVTSAYFSPADGKYILTTSWDDTIRVLEVTSSSKLQHKREFKHLNRTNRWISPFKATWDPRNGRGFVIGSMMPGRRVQFYHAEQQLTAVLLERFDENLTTIASTNVFHPTRNIIASGNSSGKVYVWSE